ncbi:hypothetical protein [Flaviaesturariibacter amylovorans]|uniref:Lipoprotein n=1 Tax=Flaviaesturariibacter amylovorans TaxID=1084520 RepID=A0ABP8GLN8_9BACT
MRNTLLLLSLCGLLVACSKERIPNTQPPGNPEHPEMRYTDLQHAAVHSGFRKVDLNGDGQPDLHFKVQLVADNVLQVTKKQFSVRAEIGSRLLINEQNETPVFPLLGKIGEGHTGFEWFEVNESVLAERLTGATDTWWDGLWKSAQRRYLAVQVWVAGRPYHGWVELSVDRAGEQVLLHRAALSVAADRVVRAGY